MGCRELTPDEIAQRERAMVAERRRRAMGGLGRKTRRATVHDQRHTSWMPAVNVDDPLRYVPGITRKQFEHLVAQRERKAAKS